MQIYEILDKLTIHKKQITLSKEEQNLLYLYVKDIEQKLENAEEYIDEIKDILEERRLYLMEIKNLNYWKTKYIESQKENIELKNAVDKFKSFTFQNNQTKAKQFAKIQELQNKLDDISELKETSKILHNCIKNLNVDTEIVRCYIELNKLIMEVENG